MIDLRNLDIVDFDVSQLMSNNHMKKLDLNGNKIPRVDLTPLTSCKRIQEVVLHGSTEGETILSDSTMEKISEEVVYDEITNFDALSYLPSFNSLLYSLSYVRKHEPKWKLLHLFRNALVVQGFGWMGLLDIGMKKIEHFLKNLSSSGFTETDQNELMALLIKQIDRGGTTIDLEIESMKRYGELVIRIDDVVKLRNEEMKLPFVPVLTFGIDEETIELLESVGDSVDTHYADLRSLWLTAYGHEIMESLALRTTCEMKKYPQVADALTTLGFEIPTLPESESYSIIGWRNRRTLRKHGVSSPEPKIEVPKHLSSEMIEYIWQLAEYRNDILSD